MDASLLEKPYFWQDDAVCVPNGRPGNVHDIPQLNGHVLFQTSGSSGEPKWIALSKRALLVSAAAVNRHLEVTQVSCWGLSLPLHHVGGFGVAARAFESGTRLAVFPKRWDAAVFHEWLSVENVSHLSLVPTQIHDLTKIALAAPAALRAVVVGGGHLDEATGRAARALGWPVLASYGMTEAGSQIATQGIKLLQTPYQCAPIPLLPIWQARTGTSGLLEISGDSLFSGTLGPDGYVPRPDAWHITSDLARLDGRLLTPLGRADARVKILGELVDPLAIEKSLVALSAHTLAPGSFAVIAVANARMEHALVPVFEEVCRRPLVFDLIEKHNSSAKGYERLRKPVFLAEIPRGALGKILRGGLREMLEQSSEEQ